VREVVACTHAGFVDEPNGPKMTMRERAVIQIFTLYVEWALVGGGGVCDPRMNSIS
jgi:hypothetical protein